MKNSTLTFLLFLITFSSAFGQYSKEEIQTINEEKQKLKNSQLRSVQDISGVCDAMTVVTNQGDGIGWDDCEGLSYEGTVEFVSVDGNQYNVYSTSPGGIDFNDQSFGAYYACYGSDAQSGLPNSDDSAPTLYFNVSDEGELSFTGSSQWGEVYSLDNVMMDGANMSFNWTNDYGEGASVDLTRQDGQSWETLLTPCTFDSEADSMALVAFYNATDGDNWNISWDLNTPVSTWYGVTLDPVSCRVTQIDLGPSEMLFSMGFETNGLNGMIPAEIEGLSELSILDLRNNQIQGESLHNLTSLVNLDYLDLSFNMLTGSIPEDLTDMSYLRILTVSQNDLEGELPADLHTMESLEVLFASANNLIGEIPSEWGSFSALRQLSMWGNEFTGEIPGELGNMSTLTNLTLDFNNLSGEIPAELGQMDQLNRLRLSFNNLTGSVPAGFNSIFILRLNDNNFSGEFSSDIGANAVVAEINLSNNNFTGPIPSRFFSSFLFQELYFANNDFSGCVDNLDELCTKPFNEVLDTVTIGDTMYFASYSTGYNLTGNPKLAWQGDLSPACDGEEQIGAPCDDGDPETKNDRLDADCICTQILSSKEIAQINGLQITPNPTLKGSAAILSIDLNDAFHARIELIDVTGNMIYSEVVDFQSGKHRMPLPTQSLAKGLYFITIESDAATMIKKMTIH